MHVDDLDLNYDALQVDIFYFFWQTFLSLPKHQATATRFITLVAGHQNVLVSLGNVPLVMTVYFWHAKFCYEDEH